MLNCYFKARIHKTLTFYTCTCTNTHASTQSSLQRPEVEVKSAAKASVCTSKSCVGGWWIPAESRCSHERSISGVKASLKRPLLSDKHLLSSEGCSTTSMEEEEEEEVGWCRVGWGGSVTLYIESKCLVTFACSHREQGQPPSWWLHIFFSVCCLNCWTSVCCCFKLSTRPASNAAGNAKSSLMLGLSGVCLHLAEWISGKTINTHCAIKLEHKSTKQTWILRGETRLQQPQLQTPSSGSLQRRPVKLTQTHIPANFKCLHHACLSEELENLVCIVPLVASNPANIVLRLTLSLLFLFLVRRINWTTLVPKLYFV